MTSMNTNLVYRGCKRDQPRVPILARFLRHVRQEGECLVWTGSLTGGGYAQFRVPKFGGGWQHIQAHRWAWEQVYGPLPKHLDLDHLCRNRRCVNLWHLESVTRSINVLRGVGRRNGAQFQLSKTHCPAGHEYGGANLLYENNGRARRCRACKNARQRRAKKETL